MRKRVPMVIVAAALLSGCSTLNVDLSSIADEVGRQQHREACLKEYNFPCVGQDEASWSSHRPVEGAYAVGEESGDSP